MVTRSGRTLSVVLVALLLIIRPESGGFDGRGLELVTPAEAQDGQLRLITFPVAGLTNFTDTFGACRDGCSRSHVGVDIFAAKLAPLVAAVDGTIVSERRNADGNPGNKIVIEDTEGWRYSYFHLNNDSPGTDDNANPQSWIVADGLRAGDSVRAGDIIGYLGDSGNAETTPAHLHFEIAPPGGSAINPTPSVTAARGRDQAVSGEVFRAPESDLDEWVDIIEDWYADVGGRAPTDPELDAWSNRLALGLGTEADLIGDLAMSAPHREPEGVALRAYVATFGRLPDEGALDLLADAYRAGATADDLAERIAGSVDYQGLEDPVAADDIAQISLDTDVAQQTWHLFQVVRAFRAAADRLPDADEIDTWTHYLDQEGLMIDVVTGALTGTLPSGAPPYAGQFSANDLGYRPGETVRQGPVELDPDGSEDAVFAERRSSGGDAEVDFELAVEKGEDGSDTANLTVRIPLDQLAATGDAELTVELRLSQPADPDDDAEAEADVELAISGSDSGGRTRPTVDAPTTTSPTTPRPTTSLPAVTRPTTTRPTATSPTTSPATTSPPTTAASSSTTTTTCPTTTTTGDAGQSSTTAQGDATTTTLPDSGQPCDADTTTTTTATTAETNDTSTSTSAAATTLNSAPSQTTASGTVATTIGAGTAAD